jgi:transcriptional regulator with XRE-family HTH domain
MSERTTGADEPTQPAATSGQAASGERAPESAKSDPGVLAQRLRYLFEHKRKPDGKRYSYREVLKAIDERGGPSMSVGYLSQLVTGVRTNPMMDAVQALAKFFEVPLTYFDVLEDTAEANERLKLVAALQHAGVQDVAAHAVGLPPESIELVLSMIDRVRQVEGLPPVDASPDNTE